MRLLCEDGMPLDGVVSFGPIIVAYETYGALSDNHGQCHPGMPRPHRRRSCGGVDERAEKARMVGLDDRPRQGL